MAIRSPNKLPNKDPKSAPANAPAKSMPSIPMLITATRSHIIPAMAARAIGTALTTVACNIPVREKDFPAVAQTKKAATAKKKLIAKNIVYSLGALTIKRAPKKAIIRDAIPIKFSAGSIKFGNAYGSEGLERRNVACPSITNTKNMKTTRASKMRKEPAIREP